MLAVKFKQKVHSSRSNWLEECCHFHSCAQDVQPEELCESALTDINEESGCDETDETIPEEVTLAKKLCIASIVQRTKLLAADPNLERSVPIWQGTEKMPVPYLKVIPFIYFNVYAKK